MTARIHVGTLAAGVLITVMALILLTEGLGWWELHRSDLSYLVPVLIILMGVATIVGSLDAPVADRDGRAEAEDSG